MTKAKQPAKRHKAGSSPVPNTADYSQFIKLIDLAKIWMVKMDFILETECNPPKEYQMQIGRTPGDLKTYGDHLCINLGFEIKGKAAEINIFTGHYHFAIVFTFKDRDRVLALLKDKQIQASFLGAQADKLVWSYLRNALQQVLLDAGLPAVVLPLYR